MVTVTMYNAGGELESDVCDDADAKAVLMRMIEALDHVAPGDTFKVEQVVE